MIELKSTVAPNIISWGTNLECKIDVRDKYRYTDAKLLMADNNSGWFFDLQEFILDSYSLVNNTIWNDPSSNSGGYRMQFGDSRKVRSESQGKRGFEGNLGFHEKMDRRPWTDGLSDW